MATAIHAPSRDLSQQSFSLYPEQQQHNMATMQQAMDDDMLIDPRMALPLYGIKSADKDAASDSPGQFMMTPRMFASDNDDALDNPVDFMLQDAADGDAGSIEVAAPHIISPPETVSHNTPPSDETSTEAAASSSKKSSSSSSSATPTTRASKRKRTRAATAVSNNGSGSKRAAQQPASASTSTAQAQPSTAPRRGSEPRGVDAKRTHCLERNRIAASKCREKKKQWVHDLEARKSELEAQHAGLHAELASLADEVTQIKNYLMGHAGCGDANIDMWIENEALRFVHRSVSGADQAHAHVDVGASRHSSIGSLASTAMHSRNGKDASVVY